MVVSFLGVTAPAQALTVCSPGQYVSVVDPLVCNSAKPGTFTDVSGSLAAIDCPPGMYNPYIGATNCITASEGHYVSQFGARLQWKCSEGTYAANAGSASCASAAAGKYVPSVGATVETACPTRTGNGVQSSSLLANKYLIGCYTFTSDVLVLPEPNLVTPYDTEIPFQFYINTPNFSTSNFLHFTFTKASDNTKIYDYVTDARPTPWTNYSDNDWRYQIHTVPMRWTNNAFTWGCTGVCPSETYNSSYANLRTTIPADTYNVEVTYYAGATQQSFTVANVKIEDRSTREPNVYVANPIFIKPTDTLPVDFGLNEFSYTTNSLKITLKNKPQGVTATKTHIFNMTDTAFGLGLAIKLPLNGITNAPNPEYFASESGDPITPGQWWVSVTFQDQYANPAATGWWDIPYLIVQDCAPGYFSVDGISPCQATNPGFMTNYPEVSSFSEDSSAFSENPCSPGSYQPGTAQTACLVAQAGYFVASSAATAQTPCATGYTSTAGATECTPISEPSKEVVSTLTPCAVKVKKKASEKCLLTAAGKTRPAKSKLKITVPKASKKLCKVSGSKVKVLKAGSCVATLTYKPKRGAKVIYRATIVGS